MSDDKQDNLTLEDNDSESNKQKQKVAALVKLAKGEDRSISAYARAAGVSTAAISKILNLEYMPSAGTMRKLTSEAAAPRGGVTFDEMSRAAGWATEERDFADSDITLPEESDGSGVKGSVTNDYLVAGNPASRLDYRCQILTLEKECISQVYTALVEKGILFKKGDMENGPRRSSLIDLDLLLVQQSVKEWDINFMFFLADPSRVFSGRIFTRLGCLLQMETDELKKISIIINSETGFQYIKRYDHKLPYRGELSVILYDSEKKEFVDECYLSNYHEGDTSKEIYIVEKQK